MGSQSSHSFEVDVPGRLSPALAILTYSGLREPALICCFCVLTNCVEMGECFAQPSEITVQDKLTVHLPVLKRDSTHITPGESRFCHFMHTSQVKSS